MERTEDNDRFNERQCDRCANFSGSEVAQFLWCAIRPYGPPPSQLCPDSGQLEEDDSWFLPEEYLAVVNEKLQDLLFYLSPAERSHWQKSCPSYTGVCPRCLGEFGDEAQLEGEWSCPGCGWVDGGD
jgi:hypothetical protein